MIRPINELTADDISVFWDDLISVAEKESKKNVLISGLIDYLILKPQGIGNILSAIIVEGLGNIPHFERSFGNICKNIISSNPDIVCDSTRDINAFYQRDPACKKKYQVIIFYKGFHALLVHRVANSLWRCGQHDFAHYLNYLASCKFGVDIHPGAKISGGVFLDHGTGIVIGETAVIEKNVSILQGVTLGGTGKETKDRHPKVAESVLIGAGAKLLGNIKIGKYSKIGAGTVLLKDVTENSTVVGVPGKVVGVLPEDERPGQSMDQKLD